MSGPKSNSVGLAEGQPLRGNDELLARMPPQDFVDYVARNYSGEVVFSDPAWHAKRLWRAAIHAGATRTAVPAAEEQVSGPDELLAEIDHATKLDRRTTQWAYLTDLLVRCHTRIAANAALADTFYMDYRMKCDAQTKTLHVENAALAARCRELEQDANTLRKLLAFAYVGGTGGYLYGDDGELQDNRWPTIDFRRDTPEEIETKITTRGNAALAKESESSIPQSQAEGER